MAKPELEQTLLRGCRSMDNFEKLKRVGKGAYGVVFKARDKKTGEIVALKKIKKERKEKGFPPTTLSEIVILRKLNHENVVKLKEVVTSLGPNYSESKELYMVLEYMDSDLFQLDCSSNKFSVPEIKCLMKQLLTGLQYCHANNVLHRDLKPANLLLNNQGILKVADFGLARSVSNDQDGELTVYVVALGYRAPELLFGCTQYGPAVDMWSAGCIFAGLLLGRRLFHGESVADLINNIFDCFGVPDESNWPGVTKLPHYHNYRRSLRGKRSIREHLQQVDSSAMDLLEKMLTLDPAKRISAKDALDDDYFRTNPLPCEPKSLRTCESLAEPQATKKRQQKMRCMKADAVKRQKL